MKNMSPTRNQNHVGLGNFASNGIKSETSLINFVQTPRKKESMMKVVLTRREGLGQKYPSVISDESR